MPPHPAQTRGRLDTGAQWGLAQPSGRIPGPGGTRPRSRTEGDGGRVIGRPGDRESRGRREGGNLGSALGRHRPSVGRSAARESTVAVTPFSRYEVAFPAVPLWR